MFIDVVTVNDEAYLLYIIKECLQLLQVTKMNLFNLLLQRKDLSSFYEKKGGEEHIINLIK